MEAAAEGQHVFWDDFERGAMGRRDAEKLFRPQAEQLGMELRPAGDSFIGTIDTDLAQGSLHACVVDGICLFSAHCLEPRRDIALEEVSSEAICLAAMDHRSASLCPVEQNGSDIPDTIAFGMHEGCQTFWLPAGQRFASISLSFLPDAWTLFGKEKGSALESLPQRMGQTLPGDLASAFSRTCRSLTPLFGGKIASAAMVRSCAACLLSALATWELSAFRAAQAGGDWAQRALASAAKRYIHDHLAEDLTISRIAHDLGTSRTRLCAVFAAEEGMPLGTYARKARMDRARELLLCRSLTIAEISKLVGYGHPASFTVAFRSECGTSPASWRKERS